jgi:parallel beta-helix repeat protein
MVKSSCILVFALVLFLGGHSAYGDFYVISGSRGVGTVIKSLPYTITSPGFYYLIQELTHDGTAITVNADNVTIDLMGFSLIGSGSGNGISMSGRSNVEVRNGTIKGFYYGIREDSTDGRHHRVINVRLEGNSMGIFLDSRGNFIKDCSAFENGDGIYVSSLSTVTGNTSNYNDYWGIFAGWSCTVTGNTVCLNDGTGLYAGRYSTIVGNTASSNNYYGIYPQSDCLVDQNTAVANDRAGGYANIKECISCTFGLNHAP